MTTTDLKKKYSVKKFWDDHFEGVVGSGLSKEEAYELIERKERGMGQGYTSYHVVEETSN